MPFVEVFLYNSQADREFRFLLGDLHKELSREDSFFPFGVEDSARSVHCELSMFDIDRWHRRTRIFLRILHYN